MPRHGRRREVRIGLAVLKGEAGTTILSPLPDDELAFVGVEDMPGAFARSGSVCLGSPVQ